MGPSASHRPKEIFEPIRKVAESMHRLIGIGFVLTLFIELALAGQGDDGEDRSLRRGGGRRKRVANQRFR